MSKLFINVKKWKCWNCQNCSKMWILSDMMTKIAWKFPNYWKTSTSFEHVKIVYKCHKCWKDCREWQNCLIMSKLIKNAQRKTFNNVKTFLNYLIMPILFENVKIVRKFRNPWKISRLYDNVKIIWKSQINENIENFENVQIVWTCQNCSKMTNLFKNIKAIRIMIENIQNMSKLLDNIKMVEKRSNRLEMPKSLQNIKKIWKYQNCAKI